MKRAFVTFAFVFVAACNSPTGIGSPCTVDAECDRGQYCNSGTPGGFCTRSCSFDGSKQDCPTGSVCTSLVATDPADAQLNNGPSLVCAVICTSASQCRDQHACGPVGASGAVSSCKPLKFKPL